MKKLSLLFMAVAFLCPKVANAQDGKGSINFVPYVGVNYSDISGDDYIYGETSGKVNFMGASLFEFKIAEKFAVIADLNYRRLGANVKVRDTFSIPENPDAFHDDHAYIVISETKKYTMDYFSSGLQFKQNIIDAFSVRTGIECSFLLSARQYYNLVMYNLPTLDPVTGLYTLTPENRVDDFDFFNGMKGGKDYYEKMEYMSKVFISVPIGFTYEYKNFSMNATYHLPLTKCAEGNDNWGDCSLRNHAFDLTIGYRLPLRKR